MKHQHNNVPMSRPPRSNSHAVIRGRTGSGWGSVGYFTQDPMLKTDLQSALHQIEGHHSRVRDAAAHNATKSTKEQVLLGAKLTTVPL